MTDRDAPLAQRLYALLADRGFHSGEELAAACGVSPRSVRRSIAELRALDLAVETAARRGYRLPGATPPLEAGRIRDGLSREAASRLRRGRVVWSTGSTNADLLAQTDLSAGQFDFLAAEHQSAGRGRRGRTWFAPPGGSICLSLSWSFASLACGVGALGLAAGVWVLRALDRCGVGGVALKWPNDLVAGGCKLGGILAELRSESAGSAYVVIGIGLNVILGPRVLGRVRETGTAATDVAALAGAPVDRNELTAALISEAIAGVQRFEREGFEAFLPAWRAADALAGCAVQVTLDSEVVIGHARGIDADGALCVQTREGLRRFTTGDASVRAAP